MRSGLSSIICILFSIGVIGCAPRPSADPPVAADRLAALVVTTDFESGSYSVIDVESRTVQRDIAAVHSDLACRFDPVAGAPFIIERFGADAVDVIDPASNWKIAKQYSVGAGSNPQDIVAVSPDRAYVARLGADSLDVVRPKSGALLDRVDLSAFADADGIPEITRLHYRNDKIFALAARLENFHPTDKSAMLVIDGPLGTVEAEITLSFLNPAGPLRYSEAVGKLVVIETGGFSSTGGTDALDGIVEYFDPDTYAVSGPIITAVALGGDIIDAIVVAPDKGYAIVERPLGDDYETALVRFNPKTGEASKTLSSAPNFAYPFIEVTPDGSELWLLDRTRTAPGIRIFDVETDELLTETPIDVGLPPFMLCFAVPKAVTVEDAGAGEEDTGQVDAGEMEDAGLLPSVDLFMKGTSDSASIWSDASCPVPTAPALTVIAADEVLRFATDDVEAAIETGVSFDLSASAPEAWALSSEVAFDAQRAPYGVKVFARATTSGCTPDIVFEHVYNIRAAYPGPAGATDSTALALDDPAIVAWADGYIEPVSYGEAVDEKWRTPEKALGPAVGTSYDVVSLGRGGEITLTFADGIRDDEGFDFAVFENSASDEFLDLAAVSVSTDGVTFARFDNASRTAEPVDAFGRVDTTEIEGLAGKYRQGFGQPFDLNTLTYAPEVLLGEVDLLDIHFIKFTDVVGDGSVKDSFDRPIYAPYPCTGSAGFDLDAVGVLHPV